MEKSERFLWGTIAFLVGIMLGDFYFEASFGFIFAVLAVFVVLIISRVSFVELLLFAALMVLGFWRIGGVLSEEIKELDPGLKAISGRVVEEVDVRIDKVKYTLLVPEVGVFLVDAPRYPVYEYGDELEVTGKVKETFVQDGFDYGRYLKLHGIGFWFEAKGMKLLRKNDLDFLEKVKQRLFWFKAKLEGQIDELYPEPYANFLKGLLLGSRKGINPKLAEYFQVVGLSHVVAISGYNITILIVVVSGGLMFLTKNLRIAISIVFIVLFVILVGASAAVVRAGVMGVISLIALYFGRSYLAFRALFLTAGIMCFLNPLTLMDDVGFQLSFLSTLGMVGMMDYFENLMILIKKSFWKLLVFEAVCSTFVSMLMTLPVLLGSFGGLSIISPLANLLVLPFVPFVMLFGFLAMILSFWFLGLGKMVAFFAYVMLKIIFFVAEFLAGFDFSFILLNRPNFYFCVVYYYAISVALLRKNLT